ncbi:MAG: 16S rRNA (uracil(1498)-N(3))-methyltransferase [Bacteroidales bacterium]|nr:16S rRNA (uracil(1498)-N(3))-methyltransferase [Bacteroidales bacterium]
MHLFLAHIENNTATLNEAESTHCAKILRLSVADKILVSDGQGRLCEAELTVVNHKACEAKITREVGVFKRPYHLHVACAPTKNIDRFEWFLEKATEIGIDEITPITTEHSERTVVKCDRSERVVMAAMKQCQVPNLPTIHELKKFSDFLKTCKADRKFICYCGMEFEKQALKNALLAGANLQRLLHNHQTDVSLRFAPFDMTLLTGKQGSDFGGGAAKITPYPPSCSCRHSERSEESACCRLCNSHSQSVPNILILIGPEGDFSVKEVALAVEQGFVPITLGETRLRTETAAIVAVHTVSLTLQP